MSEGMLPTPIKTPKKKQVPKAHSAARVLFQDSTSAGDEIGPSPKRARKHKRHNGFSLETVSTEADHSRGSIQIFTDSRDNVPQLDTSEANPFIDHGLNHDASSSRKLVGTSKRRKISGEKRMDPQVEEAIKKDDGMVYVFRGKKVYRRFDDTNDEEEEIDAADEDLGLLEHMTNGHGVAKPLKTLTRRSIRPTRLFQTEEQRAARELEKEEEEALTDIEDTPTTHARGNVNSTTPVPRPNILATTERKHGRSLRSATKGSSQPAAKEDHPADRPSRATPKRPSPFDSWPRVKSGLGSAIRTSKAKKRSASEVLDD